jgi:putative DNA primase/helicase
MSEWPGILRWAIEGCLEYQRRGLDQPPAVRDATKEYLETQDAIASWLEESA